MDRLITLENVIKTYDGRNILNNINLDIFKNQLLAVMGPNGTGKSTLLRIISGLSNVSSGKRIIYSKNEEIKIGYVPDRFPKLNFNPKEYLFYMGKLQGLSEKFIENRSRELFVMFNMESMKDTRIKYLSKGTIQKVSIMQAVMDEPDILLLDEPISGQDSESEKNFISMIEQFRKRKIAIVLACHEMYLVEKLADRVINIRNGQIVSDHDKNQNKTCMKICFSLDSGIDVKLENVVDKYVEKGCTSILVNKDFSDAAILNLINSGASIVSVNLHRGEKIE